jgi:transcriptional antiterminator RfaH
MHVTCAGPAWHCLTTQRKHEHIAAAHLRNTLGIETLAPRLRFRRSTARGAAWVTEALFPKYIFARFNPSQHLRAVRYATGITGIVQFGQERAIVADEIVEELRSRFGAAATHTIEPALNPGMEVEIAEGALKGMRGILTQVMPARERVKVLLEILGRTVQAEVFLPAVIAPPQHPLLAA